MEFIKKGRKRILSFEQKCTIVKEVLEENRPKTDIATEHRIHVNSISNWIRIYNEKGVEGLRPFVKTPKVPRDQLREELKRLQEIEKKYNEQLTEIEILKKFQAFLKEKENKRHTKR
ncbi:helix-turn-helix domain-containing protein [Sporosarcina aquimarina]|uniref:Helix-turn-helix domain-containing protein n=1 Tax=Sporosarcina aquimarina TaxID=114975 RepID=A0ABU4G574_9BACL|nr:transposase [Sporosarcina aquimarina]MDW0111542.1 helix-turn-helix domain-containing protein [Sporosarcina aquimarina]